MLNFYYIEKVGVYNHGVMWIGESLNEGIEQVKLLTLADRDNYHKYELYKHNPWTTEKIIRGDGIVCNGEKL